jgi:hypothetical protein
MGLRNEKVTAKWHLQDHITYLPEANNNWSRFMREKTL